MIKEHSTHTLEAVLDRSVALKDCTAQSCARACKCTCAAISERGTRASLDTVPFHELRFGQQTRLSQCSAA